MRHITTYNKIKEENLIEKKNNNKSVYYLEYDWVEKRSGDLRDKQEYISIFERKADYVCRVVKHNFSNEKMCMLIEGDAFDITKVLKGVNGSFAKYYNQKHLRQGRVFKQRYKNILIESREKHLYYSKHISDLSNATQNEKNIYAHVLVYVMKRLIPMDRLLYPSNSKDKIFRQELIRELMETKLYSAQDIANTLKISRSTFFRIIKCIKM